MAYSYSQLYSGESMPPPQYLYRQIHIHPREADVIAGEIQKVVQRLTTEHANLSAEFVQKVYGWLGHKKDEFFDQANPRIKKLAEFADYLKSRESYYRNLIVETWEQDEKPEWTAYMNSKH